MTTWSSGDEQPPFDEQRAIATVQRGDTAAFSLLVRKHQRRAYAVCRAVVGTHEDAEDAVQEGFLKAYRAIGRFEIGQPFGAWLGRIMVNAARDLRRRRAIRETDELPDNLAVASGDPGADISRHALLEAAIDALPDRQRAVFVLHEVEGFPHGEIAHMLGIAEGTAKYDLHAARQRLRQLLHAHRADL
ncbi:MAG TPA: RNA polymerase sigma factor [Gemmatimonadaceae bacterium]|nr:RNA polymerase sigma factor [Gemmatimonadaceae bacterium]